jgi:hypothetical protein
MIAGDSRLSSFTFDKSSISPAKSTTDFAGELAQHHEQRAEEHARKGDTVKAKTKRNQAAFLRGLPGLSDADGDIHCVKAFKAAAEAINILRLRGRSSLGRMMLWHISGKALSAMSNLVETDANPQAGNMLLSLLAHEVQNFERLADALPEAFRATAKLLFGIPGIISRNTEKQQDNLVRVKNLDVGAAFHLPILPTGKKGRHWKFEDRANSLAARLADEIETRMAHVWLHGFDEGTLQADVAKLQPFSVDTWQAWEELAWRILDKGKHPLLSNRETRIVNPQQEGVWTSADEWHTHRALLEAFEMLGTGNSQRTRKRMEKAAAEKARRTSGAAKG